MVSILERETREGNGGNEHESGREVCLLVCWSHFVLTCWPERSEQWTPRGMQGESLCCLNFEYLVKLS